jgi:hypothetical protein
LPGTAKEGVHVEKDFAVIFYYDPQIVKLVVYGNLDALEGVKLAVCVIRVETKMSGDLRDSDGLMLMRPQNHCQLER